MKKNYFLIVLLALVNIFSLAARNEGLCAVTINVDNPANVVISMRDGNPLDFSQGNTFQLDDSENPLTILPAENCEIVSITKDGDTVSPGGGGVYRLGITDGMKLDVTTKKVSVNKVVTFNVTDPSHLIAYVQDGDNTFNLDITEPIEIPAGTIIFVKAAPGYAIKSIIVGGKDGAVIDGVAKIRIDDDVLVQIQTEAVLPMVTFDIDFLERVTVLNADTNKPIDISSLEVPLAKGTSLIIKPADEKYGITSLTVNGEAKTAGGDGFYHVGVTEDMEIIVRTSSDVPTVRFEVDKPENVKVTVEGNDEALDVTVAHELEKGTQLVMEAANGEVRIVSVTANGFKLAPVADGKYHTSVAGDMTIAIKTKSIMPVMTFHVDAPERIKVMNGEEVLDFTNEVELPEGTEFTIEPAADNFSIISVKQGENTYTAGDDHKYHVTVAGDMEFEIKTSATLALHIEKPEGGTITVFRGETELHEGDKVESNDELTFKNTPEEGYTFFSYTVNGETCKTPYIVTGSVDITVSGTFKAVPENHAIVTFDIDNPLVSVRLYDEDFSKSIDFSQPYEIEKGLTIRVFAYTTGLKIVSCTLNGVAIQPDENNPNSYDVVIQENSLLKVTTEQLVKIVGDDTFDAALTWIGSVAIKYNGEIVHDALVRVGETVELVDTPENGYILEYIMRNYNDNDRITDKSYTVREEDRDAAMIVSFKGVFKLDEDKAVNSIESGRTYYDAAAMRIVTLGGETQVYNLSGECVISSTETDIDVSGLTKGIYIVKAQDRVFKLVKK